MPEPTSGSASGGAQLQSPIAAPREAMLPTAAPGAPGIPATAGAPVVQPVVVAATPQTSDLTTNLAAASAVDGTHPGWWIGGLLLLAAAGLLLVPAPRR